MFSRLPIARIGHSVGWLGCQQVRTTSYKTPYNDYQRAKVLSKLLRGESKGLRKLPGQAVLSLAPGNVVASRRGVPSTTISRRKKMLNKMFMNHICELISNDPIIDDLKDYGLDITNTEVGNHFKMLHVYWTIGSTEADDLIYVEQKLKSIAYKLRGELTRMQVMGEVPHIKFVQDTCGMALSKLDELLEIADYGDDYESGKRNADIKDKFEANLIDQGEDPVFSMRQDVFGIDHSAIMGRIRQHMNNVRNANKNAASDALGPAKEFTLTTSLNEIRKNALVRTRSKSVLTEFLRARRKEMKQLRGMDENKFLAPDLLEDVYFMQDDERDSNLNSEEDDQAYLDEVLCSASNNTAFEIADDLGVANLVDPSTMCDDHEKK